MFLGIVSTVFCLAGPVFSAENVRLDATVVNAKGAPVSGVVIYAEEIEGRSFPAPKERFVMNTVDLEFKPKLLAVQVGSVVDFPNEDEVHHHLYSFSKAKKFNRPLYKGKDAKAVVFDRAGIVKVGCNIHDWMKGAILVSPTPYFAVTDETGTASIIAPPQTLKFSVYHPRLKGKPEKTTQTLTLKGDRTAARWAISVREERKVERKKSTY
jgi:plastocyanin